MSSSIEILAKTCDRMGERLGMLMTWFVVRVKKKDEGRLELEVGLGLSSPYSSY